MFERPAVQRFLAQARKQSFRPRQLIVRGAATAQLHLMLEGSASLILEHESGQQAVLGYLHPGDFFGESGLCEGHALRGLTVRARGLTTVATTDADAFRRLVALDPSLAMILVEQLAGRLDHCRRQLADQFFLDVAARLRRTLLHLGRQPGAEVTDGGALVYINRLELAAMIGCSREMVARALKALEREGAVRIDGHTVWVLSQPRAATG